tara:strand:- start:1477 stop:1680 length:204 start_codon:yes stop_codon:yes gene_type:complete
MILTKRKKVMTGNLIKRVGGHRRGEVALVVGLGADKYQVILRNWVRIRYLSLGDYEWVQKEGLEIIT